MRFSLILDIVLSNRFKKDLKIIAKRGYNLDLLNSIVDTIASGATLASKHRDHALTGDYSGFRECHILLDWLLVYRIDNDELYFFSPAQALTAIYFKLPTIKTFHLFLKANECFGDFLLKSSPRNLCAHFAHFLYNNY